MQKFLIAAAGFSLLATAAHAQIDPVTGRPYNATTPGTWRQPPPLVPPPTAAQPALPKIPAPPRPPLVSREHPFTPEGIAAWDRAYNAPPKVGPFMPADEVKRERAEQKRANAAASPF